MLQLKIGRSPSCDITINDIAVSREHAVIFHDDEGNTFLTDLNSSNGTFVNGKRLEGSILLKFTDIVKVGNSLLPWRNYLKGEIPTSEITDSIDSESKSNGIQESNLENNIPNKVEDKAKFRNAVFIISGGIVLSIVGLFLLFSGHEINWFSFALFFFSFGVGSVVFALLSIWILSLFKISSTYINAIIIVLAFFMTGYISLSQSKDFTNSATQNEYHAPVDTTPTYEEPTYDETTYESEPATISTCSICGNEFSDGGFELGGNGQCKKITIGTPGFYCSCQCVSEAQSNSGVDNIEDEY